MSDDMNVVQTMPGGTVNWVREATPNDNDKTFTVPSGKLWRINGIAVIMVCSPTVGNRIMAVELRDASGNRLWYRYGPAITASSNGEIDFMPGGASSSYLNNAQSLPFPCYMLAGYSIRVWDVGNVDAADDMTVNLHYQEYDQ